jgi:hypothetical protein
MGLNTPRRTVPDGGWVNRLLNCFLTIPHLCAFLQLASHPRKEL